MLRKKMFSGKRKELVLLDLGLENSEVSGGCGGYIKDDVDDDCFWMVLKMRNEVRCVGGNNKSFLRSKMNLILVVSSKHIDET